VGAGRCHVLGVSVGTCLLCPVMGRWGWLQVEVRCSVLPLRKRGREEGLKNPLELTLNEKREVQCVILQICISVTLLHRASDLSCFHRGNLGLRNE
jgi:hypothetical protein